MSDGIGEVRRRQLRCQQWITILERRCSYTATTESVFPSIHYARSVISRSDAALRRYRRTLFKKDMEPIFFGFGFESTQLARHLQQERTQMEVQ